MDESIIDRLGLAKPRACHDGLAAWAGGGEECAALNPATGQPLATLRLATTDDYEQTAAGASVAFRRWRTWPAPARGEIVRQFGEQLRRHKDELGLLVTLEAGKIRSEGLGEVQEMIDMCDFAVGLSRQLHGLTIASERPEHRLLEQWHPLGPVGVVTSFNFPVAVWAWNAALALVCGDPVIWKPSHLTPLCAIAVQHLLRQVLEKHELRGAASLAVGDAQVGKALAADERLPLVSATGSTAMGREVAQTVAKRLGRSLLELGGNNALIVTPSADLDLALRAVVFAAVGTAGQRCTTLRRLLVHESLVESFSERLRRAYASVKIGLPWEDGVLMGPLIRPAAVEQMEAAIAAAKAEGGQVLYGGERIDRPGNFVQPTLIRATAEMRVVREETFAPILYVIPYRSLDEAIEIQNSTRYALSSAVFTDSVREAEQFLGPAGSDCGIANVNAGTSGAEIGGAFGGEKDTGGGREAGSDAWKTYMRRQTCTINYGRTLPLAQGVEFPVGE
ncbi:MAG: aldehyde dehydrogenase family protein [Pirellulales bacterium]